jgi:hypothetical protein
MSSAFPPAAMAARAHLKIGSDHPKGKMDVRFWRKGFDSTGEPEFQYGDYGRRAVKIRFRASQWPSPTMKLHRWLREVSRTNSTFLKALPFLLPLTYSAFFEDGRVALAHVVGTMSALWVRRVALAMLITVLPAYMRKLTPKRLVIVIMSLLAIISSRRWFPDHAQLPLYTTALLSLGGLLVLLVSFHIEYVFPQSFAGVKVKTILKDGVRVEPTEALAREIASEGPRPQRQHPRPDGEHDRVWRVQGHVDEGPQGAAAHALLDVQPELVLARVGQKPAAGRTVLPA